MLDLFTSVQFWADVLTIIMIDLLLSGDNAVVIALACRNLPRAQRKKGILFGVFGAIGLRVILTFSAVSLLSLAYLRLIGGLLLIWIGIKLIIPEHTHEKSGIRAETRLFGAVKTIIFADFVMSLDNVLGVAGAAKGNITLLVFGLLISIPLIAWSSQLVLKLIDRFAFIVYAGGALLGYVAGEMLVSDVAFAQVFEAQLYLNWLVPLSCALLVLCVGLWMAKGKVQARPAIDLVNEEVNFIQDKKP